MEKENLVRGCLVLTGSPRRGDLQITDRDTTQQRINVDTCVEVDPCVQCIFGSSIPNGKIDPYV